MDYGFLEAIQDHIRTSFSFSWKVLWFKKIIYKILWPFYKFDLHSFGHHLCLFKMVMQVGDQEWMTCVQWRHPHLFMVITLIYKVLQKPFKGILRKTGLYFQKLYSNFKISFSSWSCILMLNNARYMVNIVKIFSSNKAKKRFFTPLLEHQAVLPILASLYLFLLYDIEFLFKMTWTYSLF
jgi:hypothetical protein